MVKNPQIPNLIKTNPHIQAVDHYTGAADIVNFIKNEMYTN